MVLPAIPAQILGVLCWIVPRLEHVHPPWVLTGSLALRLRGVPLEVHDIDLQTTRAGAYCLQDAFANRVVRPVTFSSTERIRSFFGQLSIEGVRVEIMGDIEKKLPDGRWSQVLDLRREAIVFHWKGLSIPMLGLQHELEAYKLLGRDPTSASIARKLEQERGHAP